MTAKKLNRSGYVDDPSSLESVVKTVDPCSGGRVVDVLLADGLSVEALADRGLGFGGLWWRGRPFSWRSAPSGVTNQGIEAVLLDLWRGGMLTTCGLDNIGSIAAAVRLLYHFNFRAPFLPDCTRLSCEGGPAVARNGVAPVASPDLTPRLSDAFDGAVLAHLCGVASSDSRRAVAATPSRDIEAMTPFSAGSLPRVFEWICPARTAWALGIKSANTPLWGPERDHPEAGAPMRVPEAGFDTELTIALDVQKNAHG